jgi:hypothetical protein
MVLAYRYGLMELNTKGNGEAIKPMERENFGMLTVTFLRGIGKTIKRTVMVFTVIRMAQNTKETGKTIYKMALGLKNGLNYYLFKSLGQMDLDTKVIMHMGGRRDSGHTIGVTDPNTSDNGMTIRYQGLVVILGWMEG